MRRGQDRAEGSGRIAARVARMGLLFALAISFSALEGLLPAFIPVPGIKLGLSNIVVMYCVLALGTRRAFVLALLKALFVLFVRGGSGALMSLCGGLLSVAVMAALLAIFGQKLSYAALGMSGAVAHNLGQLGAAAALLRYPALWYYMPVLAASGAVMGLLTAVIFRAALPYLTAVGKAGPMR